MENLRKRKNFITNILSLLFSKVVADLALALISTK